MEGAFLLLDKEHRSYNRGFRWMDLCIGQILSEECIKLFLFCGGEGECPPSGEFGIGMKLYGVVPCLTRGEMGKGFFREDVENGKNTQGGNSSVDYSASLEGQSNERGLVLRQLATWLLQVQ